MNKRNTIETDKITEGMTNVNITMPVAVPKASNLGNVSIGFAVAALLFFPFIFGFVAVILGLIATARGDNKGIIGIVLGCLFGFLGWMIVLWVMWTFI